MDGAETVLLAVGPASITGLVGYAGARLQARTAQNQAQVEIQRLLLEQGDAARQKRQTAYQDFLAMLYRLDAQMLGVDREPWSKETFGTWLAEFHLSFSAVDLYGADSVREAATGVKDVIEAIGSGARAGAKKLEAFVEQFSHEYHSKREALEKAVGEMLETMRRDIFGDEATTARTRATAVR